MIERKLYLRRIREAFAVFPVVSILGPRQCGKTTLARMYTRGAKHHFFDLEDPADRARLSAPMTELERLSGLVIIDEVQRQPHLLESLRVLVDRPAQSARFLLLGSAAPEVVRGTSESLAGRVGFVDVTGFNLAEVGARANRLLWHRGGFPRSFLATSDSASRLWRDQFIRTFLERDIPQFGITIPAETIRRFWTMVAHYHGQTWNAADFARSLGATEGTARRYLDLLSGAYMVRVLPPWFENLKKRQVKAPKVYVRDTGLLHSLLALHDDASLLAHPRMGASWEGFVIEQLLGLFPTRDAYYWATHAGAELDLLILRDGKRYGFEIKYADAPATTRSMHIALSDLQLEKIFVLYPGAHRFSLDTRIEAVPLTALNTIWA